jgi:hypothetical protein
MGFPAVWAVALLWEASGRTAVNAAINENAAKALARRKLGIFSPY